MPVKNSYSANVNISTTMATETAPNNAMHMIIISGLSGSGKSIALHTLEDEGFYCVDNLPLGLLPDFTRRMMAQQINIYNQIAVGIDARSGSHDLRNFEHIMADVRQNEIKIEIIFLQADITTLFKRFSETRRKHPLTRKGMPLYEAIEIENTLLSPIATQADLILDTTHSNIHQFRSVIKERVLSRNNSDELSLLFQSFGFKHGSPHDSDFVFDVRCLPNPHWESDLRPLTGQDPEVVTFLQAYDEVEMMFVHISDFIQHWIPEFKAQNRYYLTVSIGCTGGQHRSVYLAERLCSHFGDQLPNVSLRHRELQ